MHECMYGLLIGSIRGVEFVVGRYVPHSRGSGDTPTQLQYLCCRNESLAHLPAGSVGRDEELLRDF